MKSNNNQYEIQYANTNEDFTGARSASGKSRVRRDKKGRIPEGDPPLFVSHIYILMPAIGENEINGASGFGCDGFDSISGLSFDYRDVAEEVAPRRDVNFQAGFNTKSRGINPDNQDHTYNYQVAHDNLFNLPIHFNPPQYLNYNDKYAKQMTKWANTSPGQGIQNAQNNPTIYHQQQNPTGQLRRVSYNVQGGQTNAMAGLDGMEGMTNMPGMEGMVDFSDAMIGNYPSTFINPYQLTEHQTNQLKNKHKKSKDNKHDNYGKSSSSSTLNSSKKDKPEAFSINFKIDEKMLIYILFVMVLILCGINYVLAGQNSLLWRALTASPSVPRSGFS